MKEVRNSGTAFSTKHQSVSLRVAATLLQHVESRNLGQVLQAPCDVILSRGLIVQPDIIFVEKGRSGLIGGKNLYGAPDLVVEILSQDTRERDCKEKKSLYSRFEVKECWIVDTGLERAEVLRWCEMGYATAGIYGKLDCLSSPAFPKLRLPLRRIFA